MNARVASGRLANPSRLGLFFLVSSLALRAAELPAITSPGAAVATNGYAFSYQITATGDPTGYDASGLPLGLAIDTATGLIAGTPTTSGAFDVTLIATNLLGAGTGVLSLTVGYDPPVIITQPRSLSLKSGDAAVFRLGAEGQTDLSYRWTKGGATLIDTDRISGVNGAQLSISPVLPQDAGSYEVVVSQAGRETAAQPAQLIVDVTLPAVTLDPSSQSVLSGETIPLTGAATGDPALTYRWQRDGQDLDEGARFAGTTTPTLTIAGATVEETGWYALTVNNAAGRVASNPARLTVHTNSEFAQALNFDEGLWTSGGDAPWTAQSGLTHDGISAARSGAIGGSRVTFLETTVYGPGDLSFYWMVSSESGWDLLRFIVNGSAVASISGDVGWTQRVVHLPWGAHTLRWQYTKDGSVDVALDAGALDQVAFVPTRVTSLETALDEVPLPLTAGGDAAWFGQENVSADGLSAARSGYISHHQSTMIGALVTGPGVVSFDWKVSSEGAYDRLTFLVDEIAWDAISGEVDWTNRTLHLPWGVHTLEWRYDKDGNVNSGLDAAWLDRVSYTPVGLFDLTEASDAPSLPWTSSGAQPWFGQNETTQDGSDALQSGPIAHGQNSFLHSTVAGPGTLTFSWKISSEPTYDFLVYQLDGVEKARISGTVDWARQTHVIRPGSHDVRWQYRKDGSGSVGLDSAWLDQVDFVAAPSLPVALNNTQLLWTTTGNASWFPEMVTTHDSAAAARSGDITHGQVTLLETSVNGPGDLSFYWKVSSEGGYDTLALLLDDVEQARISGEADWARRTLTIPDGAHTLKWRYAKDNSGSSGADAAWLDEVVYNSAQPVGTQLTNPVFLNGGAELGLSVDTASGRTYVLEYKNSLGDAQWTPLPGVPGDGTVKVLIDPNPAVAHRFYRLSIIAN